MTKIHRLHVTLCAYIHNADVSHTVLLMSLTRAVMLMSKKEASQPVCVCMTKAAWCEERGIAASVSDYADVSHTRC